MTKPHADEAIHTLSVYVTNTPGVLARIAQIFSRRGYNIDSLVVSPAGDGRYSRMTIAAIGSTEGLEQIIKQVGKLIDVIHCTDHTGENAVVQELGLIKIACSSEQRTEALQICEHFGGETLDLTQTLMIIRVTGNSDKLDAMINMLSTFRTIELVRTGKVVMARGDQET